MGEPFGWKMREQGLLVQVLNIRKQKNSSFAVFKRERHLAKDNKRV